MKSVNKAPSDAAECPNCKQSVTVPKSTRSFICRSCDAIIKVISSEQGATLKVVGKSVDDDPTYQAIESHVAALKEELGHLHAQYLVEADRSYGSSGSWMRNLGWLALVVGVVSIVWSAAYGVGLVLGGIVGILAGAAINASRKRAKQAAMAEISDTLQKIGAQRDLLQRKAARLKTQV